MLYTNPQVHLHEFEPTSMKGISREDISSISSQNMDRIRDEDS